MALGVPRDSWSSPVESEQTTRGSWPSGRNDWGGGTEAAELPTEEPGRAESSRKSIQLFFSLGVFDVGSTVVTNDGSSFP